MLRGGVVGGDARCRLRGGIMPPFFEPLQRFWSTVAISWGMLRGGVVGRDAPLADGKRRGRFPCLDGRERPVERDACVEGTGSGLTTVERPVERARHIYQTVWPWLPGKSLEPFLLCPLRSAAG